MSEVGDERCTRRRAAVVTSTAPCTTGIVARDHGVEDQLADAGPGEDDLGEDGARQQAADADAEQRDRRQDRDAAARSGRRCGARAGRRRAPCGCGSRPSPRASRRAPCGRGSRPSRGRSRRPAGSDGRSWSTRSPGSPAPIAGSQPSSTAKTSRRRSRRRRTGWRWSPTDRTPVSRSSQSRGGSPRSSRAGCRAATDQPRPATISARVKASCSQTMRATLRLEKTSVPRSPRSSGPEEDAGTGDQRLVEAHALAKCAATSRAWRAARARSSPDRRGSGAMQEQRRRHRENDGERQAEPPDEIAGHRRGSAARRSGSDLLKW